MIERTPLLGRCLSLRNRIHQKLASEREPAPRVSFHVPDASIQKAVLDDPPKLAHCAARPFGARLKSLWLPAASGHPLTRFEEAFPAALFWMDGSPERAFQLLRPFLDNMDMDGRIPAEVGPVSVGSEPAPPLVLWALNRLYARTGDKKGAEAAFLRAVRFVEWMSVGNKQASGLYRSRDRGWESADPFLDGEDRGFLHQGDREGLEGEPAGMNFLAAFQLQCAAKLAQAAGREREARRYGARAEQAAARSRERFWRDPAGFFFNRRGEEFQERTGIGGWMALIAEAAYEDQARRMIERLDGPGFDPASHPLPALALAEGLRRYRFVDEMSRFALGTVKAIARRISAPGRRPEGRSLGILAHVLVRDHLIGYRKFHDRAVVAPALPDEWTDRPVEATDEGVGLRLILTRKEDGGVWLNAGFEDGRRIEERLELGRFRTLMYAATGDGKLGDG